MVTISNAHADFINDTTLDYYGRRLATCSNDKTVKIFSVEGESYKLMDTLVGHEAPVWRVCWGHPKFGNLLATCSYDGKIIIWKETNGKWGQLTVQAVHSASVNSLDWCSHEYGPILLAGSSDGKVSIFKFHDGAVDTPIMIDAHKLGVLGVSWAPYVHDDNDKVNEYPSKFASGGADNMVKIWKFDADLKVYVLDESLEAHKDWVKDVAWSQTVYKRTYLASASKDKTCVVWTQEDNGLWKKNLLDSELFDSELSRVSWSLSGNVLAVSANNGKVTIWKENLEGNWEIAGDFANE